MMKLILNVLGLTPEAPKTGAREAASFVLFVAIALTIAAMFMGPSVISAMVPVLGFIWPSTLAFMGYAFKLKSDRVRDDLADNGSIYPSGNV